MRIDNDFNGYGKSGDTANFRCYRTYLYGRSQSASGNFNERYSGNLVTGF